MSFFFGALAGLFGMWLLYTGKRSHVKIIEDEKQLLQQEKQIVVEFMHNMVEAVAEGSDRAAMFQRIIHAAILSTGAMSARWTMMRPYVSYPVPPFLASSRLSARPTRAQLIPRPGIVIAMAWNQ